jgi:hypothetical protein
VYVCEFFFPCVLADLTLRSTRESLKIWTDRYTRSKRCGLRGSEFNVRMLTHLLLIHFQ